MSVSSPMMAARRSRTGRMVVVAILVVSLGASALTRNWVIERHMAVAAGGHPAAQSAVESQAAPSPLGAMPAYATALLLGGLRGPLVMLLWTSSENQKQQRNLQDFDTKIEWIRLLQPEFDTVHIFQIWNKAYNISVMLTDQSDKYRTILGGVDYGQKVDQQRPDDINIIFQIASLYGDKLGTSQEHPFYRKQVRAETQTRVRVIFPATDGMIRGFKNAAAKLGWTNSDAPMIINQKTQMASVLMERVMAGALEGQFGGEQVSYQDEVVRSDQVSPGWRLLRLDPMLKPDGNILPEMLVARFPRPEDVPAPRPFYDGSRLQFLAPFQPFPYGISTLALAYNDFKRCQMLQLQWHERHIQTSESVVDSRPAISLETWARDEWERGRRAELRMGGSSYPMNIEPDELELPAAKVSSQAGAAHPLDRDLALYSYQLASRLYWNAVVEFQSHIRRFPYNAQNLAVHIDDSLTYQSLMAGDFDYLAAASTTGAQRERLLADATEQYTQALDHASYTVLRYYVDDDIAGQVLPRGYNRASLMRVPETKLPEILAKAVPLIEGKYGRGDPSIEERTAYQTYINHAAIRLQMIKQENPATTTTAP